LRKLALRMKTGALRIPLLLHLVEKLRIRVDIPVAASESSSHESTN
jgi:hypothetical protein